MPERPKGEDLRSSGIGLRGFESLPLHYSLKLYFFLDFALVAQPVERHLGKVEVGGSNPPGHTFFYESWPVAYDFCIMVGIAQLVSASDCGSEGPGFESLYPPFFYFLGYRQAVRHRVLIPALRWFESS